MLRALVKRVALTHHDPRRDDDAIERLVTSLRQTTSVGIFAAAFQTSTLDRTEGIVGKLGVKFLLAPEFVLAIGGATAQTARVELLATAATVDQEPDVADRQAVARCLRGLPSRRTGIEGIPASKPMQEDMNDDD